jgi:hypothetical protein
MDMKNLPEGFKAGGPTSRCRGRGPLFCGKNSCVRHNACMYVGPPVKESPGPAGKPENKDS